MFFKALQWGNKGKPKVDPVALSRRLSSRFSFKKDRRAARPGGHGVSKDIPRQVAEEEVHSEKLRVDVESAPIVEDRDVRDYGTRTSSQTVVRTNASPYVTPWTSGEHSRLVPSLAFTPTLSSIDETLARLSSAFAASLSDDAIDDVRGEPSPDDYIFLCKLGDGAEGVVFLAIGRRDRKPYAVKAVPKAALPEAQFGNIFMSQYAMQAMKGSPFIIDLQASFETEDNFIFVFPFYANGDLKDKMYEPGAYSEAEARLRIAQLIVAVESLHNKRIMHRDLKPENILLNDQGDFILTDFGLCHTFGRPVEAQPWRVAGVPDWELPEDFDPEGHREAGGGDKTKLFAGTPNYMAPEMWGEDSNDGWCSYSADIWSVGIILFEILHQKLPFGLRHDDDEEYDPMTCILEAPLRVAPHLSEEVLHLLHRFLERDPNLRAGWDEIKAHPWFDGIDWDAVALNEEAPLLVTSLDDIPPIPKEMKQLHLGNPYSRDDAPYPFFHYVSADHLQSSMSTTDLYMGSPEWTPAPAILEGFGWPVEPPGNAFAMCPRLSSLPNLQKPYEVPNLGVRHASVHGSIHSDYEEEIDDSSMCSNLARCFRAGRVPGMYRPVPSSAFSSFSRRPAPSTGYDSRSEVDVMDLSAETTATDAVSDSSSADSEILLSDFQQALLVRASAVSAVVPTTSTPVKRIPGVVSGNTPSPSAVSPFKRSESIPLSEVSLFADVPRSSKSAASPRVPASWDCSATMVGSTVSAHGTSTDPNSSTMTSKTHVNSYFSAGKTSVSASDDSFSSSLSKPWVKKLMGVVKGWFNPAYRREKRASAAFAN